MLQMKFQLNFSICIRNRANDKNPFPGNPEKGFEKSLLYVLKPETLEHGKGYFFFPGSSSLAMTEDFLPEDAG